MLRALAAEFGGATDAAALQPPAVAAWFTSRWGARSPSRWNVALDALRSASRYWADQGWITEDPARLLRRMLYETAARSAEVLRLDVEDLDLPNRRAKVRRKGGAIDVIVWQTGTARLLPRLLKGRKSGPLFLTGRRARVELPPGDIDPASGRARLSYRQAEALFRAASGGATLHQLRPRWQQEHDPARRREGGRLTARRVIVGVMAAAPLPEVPEDREDPAVILRDLPERERDLFLGQYRESVEEAQDPAGYARLRKFLHDWSIRVIACNSPGYYERTDPDRVKEPGIPIEEVFPDWPERLAAAIAARA